MKKIQSKTVTPIGATNLLLAPARSDYFIEPSTLDPRQAVALAYLKRSGNPKVVAKAEGILAEEIIRKARENGIFVYESRELLLALSEFKLDEEIPPELYHALSSVIAWISPYSSPTSSDSHLHSPTIELPAR